MSTSTSTASITLENLEPREKYTVNIVGCGRIGVLHACLFASAGFKVICADTNQAVVDNLSKGKVTFLKNEIEPLLRKHLKEERLKATTDLKSAAANSQIILVAVPVELDEKGKTDYSNLERSLRHVGSSFRKGTLIIIASVVGVGVTEGLIKEVLEGASGLKARTDFYMAYSPPALMEQQTLKTLSNCKRIVAAPDKSSLELASKILGTVTESGVVKTSNVKMAEALILLEAVHRQASFALANELALFCEKTGLDYVAIQNLAKESLADGLPPLAVACENHQEAVAILLEEAENLNLKLRISAFSAFSNEEVLKHAVNVVREALKECGKTLRRAKVSILGLSQTPNMMDTPREALKKIVEILSVKGAKISLYDPYFSGKPAADFELKILKNNLAEAVEGADCIIVSAGHDQFKRLNLKKLKLTARMPAAIVDFEGVIDPVKAEAEGFIYRGLGRGVSTK
ncbi:MAG: nucleotide sugar dehydrogenase [Nitrososphaerota archaeon]|nr:nucleotide sugar dehydrogenase [Candidatus Bathyarchaeota archaeon]MDW8023283.1 nucleotide sugar dehydrogenase [Nitrososphaerota archaeon]